MKIQRRDDMADYKEKKQIFADLTKEARALNLKDIEEGSNEHSEQIVYGIIPKKYKKDLDLEVTLREVHNSNE